MSISLFCNIFFNIKKTIVDLLNGISAIFKAWPFLFFVNSPISIHSVTERNRSEFMRRLTNIIVERYIDGYNFRLPRKKNYFQKIVKYFYR